MPKPEMKKPSSFIVALNLLFALVWVAGLTGCFKSSGKKCSGTLSHGSQAFTGVGKNESEAKQFACNKYCLEADGEVDARYRIWLDSPKGKAAGSPTKQKAIYKDKGLMDYVTITCANQCVADAKAGKHSIKVECQ